MTSIKQSSRPSSTGGPPPPSKESAEQKKHKFPSRKKRKRNEGDGSNTAQQLSVADHYSSRPDLGRDARKKSPIFQLKQFNNWIKSVLIRDNVKEGDIVFDLCSGKGGDLLKYHEAKIKSYVAADIAVGSVQDSVKRYNDSQKFDNPQKRFKFDGTFVAANCITIDLANILGKRLFDVVSCQFAIHYSFENETCARTLLKNAAQNLKKGGTFIVTCPDAYVLVKKLRAQPADKLDFGNDVYKVTFEHDKHFDKDETFGLKYEFWLNDAIDNCDEYLVPPEAFQNLAKDYGLELRESMNFHEFFEKNSDREDLKHLTDTVFKLRDGNMTQDEWDAIYLYRVYIFQKTTGEERNEQSGRNPENRFREVKMTDIIKV
jgi:mRNA (guanine-N7-)-methyltransferase